MFIAFEGIDGSGKSSAMSAAAAYFRERGKTICETAQPGSTPIGQKLRELLKSHTPMTPTTQALLFAASFHEASAQLIVPALKRNEWVFSDRFSDSTIAYQSAGDSVNQQIIEGILSVSCTRQPDLTLYYDAPATVALARTAQRGESQKDRFESKGTQYQEAVRQKYLELAEQNLKGVVIDTALLNQAEVLKVTIAQIEFHASTISKQTKHKS